MGWSGEGWVGYVRLLLVNNVKKYMFAFNRSSLFGPVPFLPPPLTGFGEGEAAWRRCVFCFQVFVLKNEVSRKKKFQEEEEVSEVAKFQTVQ